MTRQIVASLFPALYSTYISTSSGCQIWGQPPLGTGIPFKSTRSYRCGSSVCWHRMLTWIAYEKIYVGLYIRWKIHCTPDVWVVQCMHLWCWLYTIYPRRGKSSFTYDNIKMSILSKRSFLRRPVLNFVVLSLKAKLSVERLTFLPLVLCSCRPAWYRIKYHLALSIHTKQLLYFFSN